jgi:hypothetical protein
VGTQVTPAPSVQVLNQAGVPIAGVAISFVQGGGGSIATTTALTGADGTASVRSWILGATPGSYVVTARTAGLPEVVFTAAASPGAATLTPLSGFGQQAAPGAELMNPLRVWVADRLSNPLAGLRVTFSVIAGGGAIERNVVDTDAMGVATSGAWTLGPASGAQQVSAQAGSVSLTFAALACPVPCEPQPAQELLFVRRGQIFVTQVVGTEARQLTVDDSGREAHPAWSPDGRRIAFVRDQTPRSGSARTWSGAELYLMNANGSDASRRAAGFHSPAWSPDGQTLAVASGDCVYDCSIHLLSAADHGISPTRVADMGAAPAWSPDGSRIAFVRLSGDDGYHALEVMDVAGSRARELVPMDASSSAILDPSWSPDGSRIAFIRCDDRDCDVFTVSPDGSGLVRLTSHRDAHSLAWSPDGTRIAVARWPRLGGEERTSIVIVSATHASEPVAVAAPGYAPAWRPARGSGG